ETELDGLPCSLRRAPAADHEAAVRRTGMIALQLLRGDDVHGRVVGLEVVRHRHDGLTHGILVGVVIEYDEALAGVLLPRRQLWPLARTHLCDRLLGGDRVLHPRGDARHAPDRIRMALAEAPAPERV